MAKEPKVTNDEKEIIGVQLRKICNELSIKDLENQNRDETEWVESH